ncbi:MAG: hypothetical protein M3Z21_09100 [Pseudomonadota bacterium]|nr:hypothetical protein [Pseudomonadota bacterium]
MKGTFTAGVLTAYAFLSGAAYAACAYDVPALESRTTTLNAIDLNEDYSRLDLAMELLTEAQALCDQGDEVGSASRADQAKNLLISINR